MSVRVGMALTLASAMSVAACGGAREEAEKTQAQIEQTAQEAKTGAENLASGAEQMARGFEQFANSLGAAAGGSTNQKPVDPVSFRDLQTTFPELSGWERSKPTGERMTRPVNFSQAEVRYTKGDAEVEVKIVDSAFNQLLVAPFAMFLAAGYEKETEQGYEKSTRIGDYPGWEKWNDQGKDGELNAVVNQRFVVQVDGRNIEDPKVLHTVMAQIDLKKLAAMQ
ncbi:MAG: hypothetical protein AB7I50_10685 [Vicinamibacterales bacterium]